MMGVRRSVTLTWRRALKLGQWLRLMASRVLSARRDDLVTSMDLCDDPLVAHVLGTVPAFHSRLVPTNARRFVGWGRKWSGRRAVDIAKDKGAEFVLLEDGFLRSVGRRDRSLSVAMDDLGVHYDASSPSRLEELIKVPLSTEEEARALALMQLWRDGRVSKYNAAPELDTELPDQYVLVIDQVRGDMSIRYGAADAQSFDNMLQTALADNPTSQVIVKLHPDVFTDAAKSHFDPERLRKMDRVQVVAENCHPVSLIEHAQAVYTVTSQVGFEALIWGKPVHVFGMPFYAGWGLTKDALPAPDRRGHSSLAQLVHAALIRYVRYIDPFTDKAWEAEDAVRHVTLQRQHRFKLPAQVTALGFSPWKRRFVGQFFADTKVRFARHASPDMPVAIWGRNQAPEVAKAVLRIEDGFLRSAGLGADLIRPSSLVIDQTGIYYDATGPSDLEAILNNIDLTDDQISRAQRLRESIVSEGVSKYNVGVRAWTRPKHAEKIVLVAGQVETDASLAFGSPDVKTNLELLKRARELHPNDYVVFKPHPDVMAGLRDIQGAKDPYVAHCDEVLTVDIAPDHLLAQVDVVHTMTSLIGFEALLRGIQVTCHGIPFYAGWGLTADMLPCPRRVGRLTLDALVYGVLIAYPRYYDFEANCFVGPEKTLETLAKLRSSSSHGNWYRKLRRRLIVFVLKLRGAKK